MTTKPSDTPRRLIFSILRHTPGDPDSVPRVENFEIDEADVLQRPVLALLLAESLAAMHCSVVVRGEAVASRRRALMRLW